jgi:hypothetical protein
MLIIWVTIIIGVSLMLLAAFSKSKSTRWAAIFGLFVLGLFCQFLSLYFRSIEQ